MICHLLHAHPKKGRPNYIFIIYFLIFTCWVLYTFENYRPTCNYLNFCNAKMLGSRKRHNDSYQKIFTNWLPDKEYIYADSGIAIIGCALCAMHKGHRWSEGSLTMSSIYFFYFQNEINLTKPKSTRIRYGVSTQLFYWCVFFPLNLSLY